MHQIPERTTSPDWTFENETLAEEFTAHVRAHLPFYDLWTDAVASLARHFIVERGVVVDLGAATGNIGRILAPTLAERQARLIAVEPSRAMAARYTGPGEVRVVPAQEFAPPRCCLIVAFLTLMFVPPAVRGALFQRCLAALEPGGALILVDREAAPGGAAATLTARMLWQAKAAAGVPAAEIATKELSLAGVQRPLERGFAGAVPDGFSVVEVLRYGEFAGWVAMQR